MGDSWHGRSLQPGLHPPAGETSVPERREVSPSREKRREERSEREGGKKREKKERQKEKTWREARQPLANRSAAVIKFAGTLNGSELLDGPESGQLTSQPSARVSGGGGASDWAPEAPPSREII